MDPKCWKCGKPAVVILGPAWCRECYLADDGEHIQARSCGKAEAIRRLKDEPLTIATNPVS
jgi:hypothetical protein